MCYRRKRKQKNKAYLDKFNTEHLDLHRPYVDDIILVSDAGQKLFREPDLIDVWFDSGAMPYAQWGLDHEKLAKGDEFPFKQDLTTLIQQILSPRELTRHVVGFLPSMRSRP